jgi:hypothetical protein
LHGLIYSSSVDLVEQVFIDAHCKVSDNWLRPIVRLLQANPNRLLNMEVGLLNGETWKQERPGAIGAKASFNWKLDHFWEPGNSARIGMRLSSSQFCCC